MEKFIINDVEKVKINYLIEISFNDLVSQGS